MAEQAQEQEIVEKAVNELLTETQQVPAEQIVAQELKQEIMDRFGVDEFLADKILQIYMERKNRDFELTKQALNILPALAQTDNPLTVLAITNLLGRKKEDSTSEAKELAEVYKTMKQFQMEMMLTKKMIESMDFGDSTSKLLLQYALNKADEKEKELRELLKELLATKKEEEARALREEVGRMVEELKTIVADVVETVAAMAQSQAQPQVQGGGSSLSDLKKTIEDAKKLLEELGLKVSTPVPQDEQELEKELRRMELQLKMKELELKAQDLQAKQEITKAFADAIRNLLGNADNLVKLLQGVRDLWRPPQPAVRGMQQVAQLPELDITPQPQPAPQPTQAPAQIPEPPEPKPPKEIDLDNLLEEVEEGG